MAIKLPLRTSFAFLCGFVSTLRDGIELVAEDVTENAAAIDQLRHDIVAGTV